MEAIIYVFTHLRFISKLQVYEFNLDDMMIKKDTKYF